MRDGIAGVGGVEGLPILHLMDNEQLGGMRMAAIKPWTVEIWRLIAILALAISTLLGCVIIYVIFAFKSNWDVMVRGAPICLQDSRAYDSIAAAQAIGRLDLVSFLLTTGGVLLGLFSLLGFWIVRREARDEAREAAAEEARRISQLYFGKNENGNKEGDIAHQGPHIGIGPNGASPATYDPNAVSTAGAVEEGRRAT